MSSDRHIRYLTRREIDNNKWDACIAMAPNERIYPYTWYLDQMAKNWSALVSNDYEAVMPLPWNRKYGIKYIYQPFLTAQLGIFGSNNTAALTDSFISHIPSSFRLVEISFNSANHPASPQVFMRNNYVLALDKTYDELFNSYNANTQRNCRKAWQGGCTVEKSIETAQVIELALQQMKQYGTPPAENVNRFRELEKKLSAKGQARTYGIAQHGKLLASAVFFFSGNRAYYILVGNHPDSKLVGASHALIDAFIKDHSNRKLILDFEGSDIPGLAAFYAGFGALPEPYPFLKINRLPFFLKWLKK